MNGDVFLLPHRSTGKRNETALLELEGLIVRVYRVDSARAACEHELEQSSLLVPMAVSKREFIEILLEILRTHVMVHPN